MPRQVVGKEGNSVIVESPQRAQYQRNVTQVKKYLTPDKHSSDPVNSNELEQSAETTSDVKDEPPAMEELSRPVRIRKPPKGFDDFIFLLRDNEDTLVVILTLIGH